MPSTPPELVAQAWCGKWFSATAGELRLMGGHLRFTAEERTVFDAAVRSAKIRWPWYSASAAFETQVDGKSYFVSFVPRHPTASQRYDGKREGRRWRAAVTGVEEPAVRSKLRLAMGIAAQAGVAIFRALAALVCGVLAFQQESPLYVRILLGVMGAGSAVLAVLGLIQLFRELREPGQK